MSGFCLQVNARWSVLGSAQVRQLHAVLSMAMGSCCLLWRFPCCSFGCLCINSACSPSFSSHAIARALLNNTDALCLSLFGRTFYFCFHSSAAVTVSSKPVL